jgi:hypothetical protein
MGRARLAVVLLVALAAGSCRSKIEPPPIVLDATGARQEAWQGGYSITKGDEGLCSDSALGHPEQLTVVRPGESPFQRLNRENAYVVDIRPGAYELQVVGRFETPDGRQGRTLGILALLVDPKGEPAVIPVTDEHESAPSRPQRDGTGDSEQLELVRIDLPRRRLDDGTAGWTLRPAGAVELGGLAAHEAFLDVPAQERAERLVERMAREVVGRADSRDEIRADERYDRHRRLKRPTTFPRIWTWSGNSGSRAAFSGWRRMRPLSRWNVFTVASPAASSSPTSAATTSPLSAVCWRRTTT